MSDADGQILLSYQSGVFVPTVIDQFCLVPEISAVPETISSLWPGRKSRYGSGLAFNSTIGADSEPNICLIFRVASSTPRCEGTTDPARCRRSRSGCREFWDSRRCRSCLGLTPRQDPAPRARSNTHQPSSAGSQLSHSLAARIHP